MTHDAIAKLLHGSMREWRGLLNAGQGLTCWQREGHDRQWGLWRDDGDRQLVDWQDLGPDGMIWAVWVSPHDPDDMIIALEHRDDAGDPAGAYVQLMRLPAGTSCPYPVSADDSRGVERVYLSDDDIVLSWAPTGAGGAADAGIGLMDLDFQVCMPPVAFSTPSPVKDQPRLVRYQHHRGNGNGAWGVFDVKARVEIIAPVYQALERHDGRWIATRPDGGCEVLSADGVLLSRHAHTLYFEPQRGEWYAEQHGPWARANADGTVDGPFAYDSLEALTDPPLMLIDLVAPDRDDACAVLPSRVLKALRRDLARDTGCYKYEGLEAVSPHDGGDGYADLSRALLPNDGKALLLTLRYAVARWLVLERKWAHLPAGSLLRLEPDPASGTLRATVCPPGESDEAFVTCLIASP